MIKILENNYNRYSIVHYFDLGIILYIDKETQIFYDILKSNVDQFQQNGIELLFVISKKRVLNCVKKVMLSYPFINYKIIMLYSSNISNHFTLLELAINNTSMKYVMMIKSLGTISNGFLYRIGTMLRHYPNYFFLFDNNPNMNEMSKYENIAIEKRFLVEANCFFENENSDYSPYLNFFKKLGILGLKALYVLNEPLHNVPVNNNVNYKQIFKKITNYNTIYNWEIDRFNIDIANTYLSSFIKHSGITKEMIKKKYNIIILAPCYNESMYIKDFIENMEKVSDGIIFLDDESTDDSYDMMHGEKVLLKVKKKRFFFDEVKNRNILLDIASFFNTDWLVFMDIDERFDKRFCDLKLIGQNETIGSCAFSLVHLWDTPLLYNSTFPNSNQGVVLTDRMFRSLGHLKINTNKKYHFSANPHFCDWTSAVQILILHLGNLTQEARQAKYEFYMREDSQNNSNKYAYSYLIDNNLLLKKLSELNIVV